jgi:hypothetical protein
MNCDDCRQRLQLRLDGKDGVGDDLETHLVHCSSCRELDAAARRLLAGLLTAPAPTPPAGLAERIVAGVLADRRRRRRRPVLAAGALALAASLVLAVWLGHHPAGGSSNGPTVVAVEPSPSMPKQDEPVPPSLNDHVAEATSAVTSLARKTADETVSNGQLLVPSVPLEMPAEEALAPALDPPAQSLRETGHGVANGLEPVAASARRAIDLFLRDIPPMNPEAKSGL